jgi:WD40 repeat protein
MIAMFSQGILGASYSPDGRRIATAGADGTVRIWDATTGAEIQTLRGHRNWVCGVAFSPDSRFVASAGWDGVARLWDAASGEELATYRCHAPRVYGVAFSPSGDRLVTAGEDRIARVWDVAGDADALTFGDQDGFWQTAATFSPDGRRVAVGTFGNLKVRDAATGEILLVVPTTFYFNNNDLAYSPNGRRIVSCREGGPWVDLRDAETGRRIALTAAHNGVVHAVAFRPDGRRFASIARDGSIKEWDADDGRAIRTLPGHAGGGFGLAYNPDGTTLASVGWDGTVRLWDAADGGPRGVLLGASRGQHNYHGNPLAFSPDGRRIATTTEDGTVAVWDIAGGRRVLTLRGHTGEVNDVAFSPDGHRIATAGADATIKLWAAADGMEVFTLRGHGSSVLTVGYSPDGRRIVSSSIDGTVKVWDPDPIAPAVARSRWISARAEPIVMNLFNAKELMKDEVLGRLRESSLGEPLRSAALRIAGRWREDSEILNQRAWLLVRGVGQDRGRYLTGLRWAEAAHRLAPEDSNVQNTLAMALYRVDHFQEALDLASRARPGNDVLYHGTHPTDLALIAMAHHRLGHREESRAIMDELRLLMKNDRWREEPEARQFLSEAEWTLSDR